MGEIYTISITPEDGKDVILLLGADRAENAAGVGNTSTGEYIIRYDDWPVVNLDAASPTENNAITYTESGDDAPFTTAGTALFDPDEGQPLEALRLSYTTAQFVNGSDERIIISGATAGGDIAFVQAQSGQLDNLVLNGTNFRVSVDTSSGVELSFTAADGGPISVENAEAILDAMHYRSLSRDIMGGPRTLTVMADGGLRKTSATLSITTVPVNDAPEFTLGENDSVEEVLSETDAGLQVSGTVMIGDPDSADTVAAAVVSVVATGDMGDLGSDNAALLAMFSINSANPIAAGEVIKSLGWAFDSGAEAFDYLKAGDRLTLSYTIRGTDSPEGATGDQIVKIHIDGTNDAPVLTHAATEAQGSAIEAGITVTGQPIATGTLSATDQDYQDVLTWTIKSGNSYSATLVGTYGTLEMTTDGNWTYTLNDEMAATQALDKDDAVTDRFIASLKDAPGAEKTQEIVISITGSNDQPLIAAIPDAVITDTVATDSFPRSTVCCPLMMSMTRRCCALV